MAKNEKDNTADGNVDIKEMNKIIEEYKKELGNMAKECAYYKDQNKILKALIQSMITGERMK